MTTIIENNFIKAVKKSTELILQIKYKIDWFDAYSKLSIEHQKRINSLDFKIYYNSIWNTLIIDMCKLYATNKNNEKSSFHTLFAYVNDNYDNLKLISETYRNNKNLHLNDVISHNDITIIVRETRNFNKDNIFNKFLQLRGNYIAHAGCLELSEISINVNEAKILIDKAVNYLNILTRNFCPDIYEYHFINESILIFKFLARYSDLVDIILENNKLCNSEISTEALLKIIRT